MYCLQQWCGVADEEMTARFPEQRLLMRAGTIGDAIIIAASILALQNEGRTLELMPSQVWCAPWWHGGERRRCDASRGAAARPRVCGFR